MSHLHLKSPLDPFMTPGVGERRRQRRPDDDNLLVIDYPSSVNRRRSARDVKAGYHGERRRQRSAPHSKAKRADGDMTVNASVLFASGATQGLWSPVASPPSCVTEGAISSVSNGSKITYEFYGTTITVNIVKFSSGAPYIVTLDDQPVGFDSYNGVESCTTDFTRNGLQKKKHTLVVQHNGTSASAANGKSTLMFQSLVYTPSDAIEVSKVDIPAIVGGVLGALVFLVVVGFVFWLWKRRKPANDESAEPFESGYQHVNTRRSDSNAGSSHITPYIDPPTNTSHSYNRKQAPDGGTSNPWAYTDTGQPGSNLSSNSRGASTGIGLGAPGADTGTGAGTGFGSGSGSGGLSGSQLRAARPRTSAPPSALNPPSTSRIPTHQPRPQANLAAPSARRASNWAPAEDDFSADGHHRDSSYSLADLSRSSGQLSPPPPSYETILNNRNSTQSPPLSPPLSNLSANTTTTASSSRRLLDIPQGQGQGEGQGRLSAGDVDTIARRVVQLMQTPQGAQAPPQPGQYHPDVKQAVEDILAQQEKEK